jgi:hypothetical protein
MRTITVQRWTGWSNTTVRRAVHSLAIEEVDLHGQTGIALASFDDDLADNAAVAPTATLLPALDPTPWDGRPETGSSGSTQVTCSTARAT